MRFPVFNVFIEQNKNHRRDRNDYKIKSDDKDKTTSDEHETEDNRRADTHANGRNNKIICKFAFLVFDFRSFFFSFGAFEEREIPRTNGLLLSNEILNALALCEELGPEHSE